jgi:hypothetical protein
MSSHDATSSAQYLLLQRGRGGSVDLERPYVDFCSLFKFLRAQHFVPHSFETMSVNDFPLAPPIAFLPPNLVAQVQATRYLLIAVTTVRTVSSDIYTTY